MKPVPIDRIDLFAAAILVDATAHDGNDSLIYRAAVRFAAARCEAIGHSYTYDCRDAFGVCAYCAHQSPIASKKADAE